MTTNDRHIGDGRLTRSLRPVRLAGSAAARWAATYTAFGDRRRRKREQFVLRTAEDVTRTMGDMKGAFMKFGQILSTMSGVLPDAMAAQLATLQADAPPMSFDLVRGVIESELGAPPERVFRRFERDPIAAASIGQVHRARLHDGSDVAVKVQYPGVREAIDHDIANATMFMSVGAIIAPGVDIRTVTQDLQEGLRAELDYTRELAWQQKFFERFDGHPFVRVPRPLPELTTTRVLTQEYVEGKPFAHASTLPQAERDRIAEIIFRFCFGSIYRHRLFNGDPHPGNYLLCPDGRIAFVDYGCVVEFTTEPVERFERVILAILNSDRDAWRAAIVGAGILRPDAPFTTHELWEHMSWYWSPILDEEVTFTTELAKEMVSRNTQTMGLGGRINQHCSIPEGTVYLTRINFGLAGVLGSLNARGPWRAIVREYVEGAPPATDLGRQSAMHAPGHSI